MTKKFVLPLTLKYIQNKFFYSGTWLVLFIHIFSSHQVLTLDPSWCLTCCLNPREIQLREWCVELWDPPVGNLQSRSVSLPRHDQPAGSRTGRKRYKTTEWSRDRLMGYFIFVLSHYDWFIINPDRKCVVCNVGYRMSCPQKCPDEVYRIMQRCWEYKAENRPKFVDIQKELASVKKK